jgi:hypothetical protein
MTTWKWVYHARETANAQITKINLKASCCNYFQYSPYLYGCGLAPHADPPFLLFDYSVSSLTSQFFGPFQPIVSAKEFYILNCYFGSPLFHSTYPW